MLVSGITNKEIADYLRLEYAFMTAPELTYLDTLLGIAKDYIKSYTGIEDITVTDEEVGIGDGASTKFYVDNTPVVPDSQTIYVNAIAQVQGIDYYFNAVKGEIVFVTAPISGLEIKAAYKAGLDTYKDFVIVVMVLCQDMYDNRSMYVDKSNLNTVVQTILGMHSKNLL